jgi:hypothetical protein
MDGVEIYPPKKKPRGRDLSEEDKAHNRLISQVRVVVEQVISGVKRCHIVKGVFRNTLPGYADTVMALALVGCIILEVTAVWKTINLRGSISDDNGLT